MVDEIVGDRFRLEGLAGAGAFGDVYRATDLQTGETVALKRLRDPDPDPALVRRFEQEGKLLSMIESEHVVRLVESGIEGTQPWMALEWLQGMDLEARQLLARLELPQILQLGQQAALGLAALHRAGIVHRDLKPANFFVEEKDETLRVVLIDLGVARAPVDTKMTHAGMRIGTPAYMSPEQASGDERVGPASDLYALGVVLFEAITGFRPFAGKAPLALLAKIVLDRPPLLRSLEPGVPEVLERFVDALLAKDPDERPGPAEAVAERLAAIDPADAELEGPDTEPDSLPPPAEGRPSFLERRVLTTLFVDFAGEESRSRRQEAEELARSFGADMHPLVGHGFVAVFGTARRTGDEAPRAAHTALSVRALCPRARLSIATGRAVTDGAGVSPEVLERAGTDIARAGEKILVDEPTAKELREHFELTTATGAWALQGERSLSTAAEPRVLGRTTLFLDRAHELRTLEEAFRESVSAERPVVAIVEAEAGMGKSRLRYELFERLRGDGASQLLLRCDPTLTNVPFGVLTHAIRARAQLDPQAPEDEQRRALHDWCEAIAFGGEREMLAELVRIGGEPSARLESLRADPTALGPALQGTVEALLRALGAAGPLRLIVEDVQWADPSTVEALSWSFEALADRPIAALVLSRPRAAHVFPRLFEAARPLHLRLAPLSRRAAMRMARSMLGDELGEDRLEAIVQQAGGNPLFLEELIRSTSQGQEELPVAIQAAFQVRLDALPPSAKQAVLAASVLGRSVWVEALRELLPGQEVGLDADVLTHWEVLADRADSRFPGTRELVFRHALLQDVAYAMLREEDRARLHGRAARWLETVGERDPAVLAHHYRAAGELARATELFEAAATAALREGAMLTALEHARRGLDGDTAEEDQARLLSVAATACYRLGRYQDALEHLARAEDLEASLLTELRLAAEATRTLRRVGRLQEGITFATEKLKAIDGAGSAREPAERDAVCELQAEVAWTLYNAGHATLALRVADRARESCAAEPRTVAITASLAHVTGRALHALGRLEESVAMHREAVGRASEAGHRWRAEGARHGLGQVLLALDRLDEAVVELRAAADAGRQLRLPSTEGYALLYLALAERRRGHGEPATRAAERALALGDRMAAPMLCAAASATLGMLAIEDGALAEGRAHAEAGMDVPRAPDGWHAAARAVQLFARASAGEGVRTEAEGLARELLATHDDSWALAREAIRATYGALGDAPAAERVLKASMPPER